MTAPTNPGERALTLTPLDRRRDDLISRLRFARAEISPQAAVGAAEKSSGESEEVSALRSSIAEQERTRPVPTGFQPRSMTMKLLMANPDMTIKLTATVISLIFGARFASHLGSASQVLRRARSAMALLRLDS